MIADLPTKAMRGVRYTKRDQWHVTLKFLGECSSDEAAAALDRLQATRTTVTLGPAVSLLGARIVMLPASGLDELATAVASAFEGIGGPDENREFAGHLTIARLKGAPLRDPSMVSVIGAAISATFTAESLTLIKTEVTTEGATHTRVAQNSLA